METKEDTLFRYKKLDKRLHFESGGTSFRKIHSTSVSLAFSRTVVVLIRTIMSSYFSDNSISSVSAISCVTNFIPMLHLSLFYTENKAHMLNLVYLYHNVN